MKKAIAILLSLVMVFALVACGATPETETPTSPTPEVKEPDTSKPALHIGLSWAILDDGQTKLTNIIKDSLENDYPDYDITYTLTNADGDIAKQISDVESLLATNPDVIFIMNSVGDAGIIPAINACVDAGVPVGLGVEVAGANYTYLYEGFNHFACGQMQAEYMESVMDSSVEYFCATVSGDAGNSAGQERTRGFVESFVDKYDNASLVVSGEGNWKTDDTQALVEDWLIAFPQINVIACVNDDEAQGAVNACKAAGRDDVIILGIDGSDLGKANIESGAMACTVMIDFMKVAQASAKAMVDCAAGLLTTNRVAYTTENLGLIKK